MTKFNILFVVAVALTSCFHSSDNSDASVIREFEDAIVRMGSLVTVEGIISRSHESSGLYFSRRDLVKQTGRCVRPEPFANFKHGEKVRISGRLVRTDCGAGRICLNMCTNYVLELAEAERAHEVNPTR